MNTRTSGCGRAEHAGRRRYMAIFDELPLEVRQALADAPLNKCPGCTREALARYGIEKTLRAIERS